MRYQVASVFHVKMITDQSAPHMELVNVHHASLVTQYFPVYVLSVMMFTDQPAVAQDTVDVPNVRLDTRQTVAAHVEYVTMLTDQHALPLELDTVHHDRLATRYKPVNVVHVMMFTDWPVVPMDLVSALNVRLVTQYQRATVSHVMMPIVQPVATLGSFNVQNVTIRSHLMIAHDCASITISSTTYAQIDRFVIKGSVWLYVLLVGFLMYLERYVSSARIIAVCDPHKQNATYAIIRLF